MAIELIGKDLLIMRRLGPADMFYRNAAAAEDPYRWGVSN